MDENNYLKHRTFCKSCYNKNRRKNNNTLTQNQQLKVEDDNNKKKIKLVNSVKTKRKVKVVNSVNNNNNRTLIIGFSNCGKTYLMNHILFQKLESFFIVTKSLNQYRNIKAQTSDEFQPLEFYENSTVVFDDMLLSKQESIIGLFFTRDCHNNIDIYYITQSYFNLQKILFVIFLIKLFCLNKL